MHISLYHNISSFRHFYALKINTTLNIPVYITKNWFIYEVFGMYVGFFYFTSVSFLSYVVLQALLLCNSTIFLEYLFVLYNWFLEYQNNIPLKPFLDNKSTNFCLHENICFYSKYVVIFFIYSAHFRASVDGGTNHLYNVFMDDLDASLPDIITGDFDSIQDTVKKFYQDKVGTSIWYRYMCL